MTAASSEDRAHPPGDRWYPLRARNGQDQPQRPGEGTRNEAGAGHPSAATDGALGLRQLEEALRIKPRHNVAVINAPPESRLRLLTAGSRSPDRADVVIGFATRPADLAWLRPAYAAARAGRLAWVSYPKPNRPGTDLRRDWLIRALRQYGVEGAGDVSIDHAWSAMLLHPIKDCHPPHPPTEKDGR